MKIEKKDFDFMIKSILENYLDGNITLEESLNRIKKVNELIKLIK
ncbi:MAG TPA: hypothetical protein VGB37_14725 [Candidatus Lokiarchaeia archaeon]